jgi:hypothetical protein
MENYDIIKLVQLGDYVWHNELIDITGKREKRSKECRAKKIKLANASFVHKDCVDKEVIEKCTPLKNLYPLAAFMDLIKIDWNIYRQQMQKQGKIFDIKLQLAHNIMMIELPDELFEKYEAIKKDSAGLEPELYYLIDENYLEDETVIVEKNIKIGIY